MYRCFHSSCLAVDLVVGDRLWRLLSVDLVVGDRLWRLLSVAAGGVVVVVQTTLSKCASLGTDNRTVLVPV